MIKILHTKFNKRDPNKTYDSKDYKPWPLNEAKAHLESESINDRIRAINKTCCRHGYVFDDYLEIQDLIIQTRKKTLDDMEKQLDLSKVPQYVTTSWFNDGLAYGEVTLATFSHWSAPILGEGIVSLFITWDRLRHGDLWGQQWVWDTTEPTELLTPIKKQEWEDNRTKFSWKDRFFNLKNHHEQSQEALLKMIHENKTKK